MSTHKRRGKIIAVTLLILWIGITVIKFGFFRYSLKEIMPRKAYKVSVAVEGQNSGRQIKVHHFLAPSVIGQELVSERVNGTYNS